MERNDSERKGYINISVNVFFGFGLHASGFE